MTSNFLSSTWNVVAPALGNHLWQSTLFAIAVWLLTLLWRKNQAQARYWLWLAASLKFLVPFSLLVDFGSRLGPSRGPTETKTVVYWAMEQVSQPFGHQPLPLVFPIAPANVSSNGFGLLPIFLALVWLCGLIGVLLIWYARWRRISLALNEAVSLREGREVEALRRLEPMAGMKKPLTMLRSPASAEPGIFGIIRPVLLWPQGISEHLGDQHLEAILAHELWHVRRRDNLATAMHMLVEAIFWFHPLVWWLGARLVEERELACDEAVLALGSQRQVYAESILKTCEFCVEAPLACVSGVTGADLKKRVVRIMTQRVAEKLSLGRKLLLALAGVVVIAGPVAFGLLHAQQVRAQSTQTAAAPSLSYDVASIKPDHSEDGLVRLMNSPDGLRAEGITAKILIQFAYDVKDFQISGGPGWAESERYDIDAKMDESAIAAMNKLLPEKRIEQRRLMLQSLLAERFKLKVSHSTKELPTYALVVAKNGPKFSQSTTTPPGPSAAATQGRFRATPDELTITGMPIRGLADWLGRVLGRNVVDKTGLPGNYDLTLHFAPVGNLAANGPDPAAPPPDSSEPSIFTALQEQLGLKLEPQKGPVDTLIIDSIQKPTEN